MMTTPERFRRRQLIEGSVLIMLAVFIALQSVAFNLQSRDQQKCLEQSFSELNRALVSRSTLATESNRLKDQNAQLTADQFDWLLALFVTSASNPHPTEKERAELRERFLRETKAFQDQRADLKKQIAVVTEEQADHPLPPYPAGKCD